MRVYFCGRIIPMKDVTWELLGDFRTYVAHDQDTHVDWPAHIKLRMRGAHLEIQRALFPPRRSFYKILIKFLQSLLRKTGLTDEARLAGEATMKGGHKTERNNLVVIRGGRR